MLSHNQLCKRIFTASNMFEWEIFGMNTLLDLYNKFEWKSTFAYKFCHSSQLNMHKKIVHDEMTFGIHVN